MFCPPFFSFANRPLVSPKKLASNDEKRENNRTATFWSVNYAFAIAATRSNVAIARHMASPNAIF